MDRDTLIHALGQLAGAEAFVGDESRPVAALATVDAAWRAYRRDAGAGAVGIAHQPADDAEALSVTVDPRRDAVLLWLADHGAAQVGTAAATLARMVGAQHRFGSPELALLDAALEALEAPTTDGPLARATGLADRSVEDPLQALRPVVTAVDALIADPRFAEAPGDAPVLTIAGRTVRGSWTGDPGGCWALNLALLTRPATAALAGPVPRSVFRRDCNADDRAAALIAQGARAAVAAFERLRRIERRGARGRAALAGLSRNARAGEAWALVVALGPVRRVHVARALGLSRAGADLQAQALAAAGLATLAPGGWIHPAPTRPAAPPVTLDHGPLEAAAADLDASMAAIDRLLARTRA